MGLFFKYMSVCLLTFAIKADAAIRMGIASDSTYCGERELAWRIKIAGESLGWTVFLDEERGSKIQEMQDLDWVICVLPNNQFLNPYCPNYQTIFHPFNFLDKQRKLLPFYEKYDGYLLTIEDRESISRGGKPFHCIPFYPTVHSVPYKEVPLNNLMTMLPVWSNRVTDVKFRILYNKLSRDGSVSFYGLNKSRSIIRHGYEGELPFDGISVIDVLQKHGISLVFHSDIHNEEGIPTSRIFEMAAASAVIISDQNAFVKKHFGDSVFYVDTSLETEDIYRQIQKHLNTIRENPKKALEMAKKAHQVFIDHFEMSQQLLELELLHRKVVAR